MMIKKIATTKILAVPRKYVIAIASYIISRKLCENDPANAQIFKLIRQIKKETEMLLTDLEAYQVYTAVKKTEKIGGDIAEVGVYKGGSAKLICEASKKKRVYLFDTFEGLPDISGEDNPMQFGKGEYSADFGMVKNYLRDYKKISFHKGVFPLSAKDVKDNRFSFVHLDVDLYSSTKDCLDFFYPRMNKGGIIISHDYPVSPGAKKAFDEFLKDKLEVAIEPSGGIQCLIVKV